MRSRQKGAAQLPAGRILFKEGDTDKRTYWLVGGVVELLHEDRRLMIRGGSPEARKPVHRNPRRSPRAWSTSASSTSRSTATRST